MTNEFLDRVKLTVQGYEGFRNYVYKDSRGFLTMGTGHRLTEEEKKIYKEGDKIDANYLDGLFEKDFKSHLDKAKKIKGFDNLSDQQKEAMIDLTFNMGGGWVTKFPSLIKYAGLVANETNPALKKIYIKKMAAELKYKDPTKGNYTLTDYWGQVGYRAEENFERLLNIMEEDDLYKVSNDQIGY